MTRLVVIDPILFALVAVDVVWVAWINRGLPIRKLFSGRRAAGREAVYNRAVDRR